MSLNLVTIAGIVHTPDGKTARGGNITVIREGRDSPDVAPTVVIGRDRYPISEAGFVTFEVHQDDWSYYTFEFVVGDFMWTKLVKVEGPMDLGDIV